MRLSATISEAGSAFAPILLSGDVVEGIAIASDIGYSAVELHLRDPGAIDLKGVKRALLDRQVALSTIGPGRAYVEEGFAFAADEPSLRIGAVDRIKSFVDAFGEFAPSIVIGLIKGRLAEACDRQTAIARIDEALVDCCEYAAGAGVTLCLEVANRYEQDYLHTVREVVSVIERLGMTNLKVLTDTFHMNIEEESLERAFAAATGRIGHVHFADNHRRYPGSGMIDFRAIAGYLAGAGYSGYAAIECLPLPDGITAATQAYAFLEPIIGGDDAGLHR